jgi:gamma-glutamylcysteine synthetase
MSTDVRCVHRVGVENEKFGFQLDTLKPMTLDNIHDLLEGMASRFGHKRIMEDGTIAGLETRALCRNGSIFRLTLIV